MNFLNGFGGGHCKVYYAVYLGTMCTTVTIGVTSKYTPNRNNRIEFVPIVRCVRSDYLKI